MFTPERRGAPFMICDVVRCFIHLGLCLLYNLLRLVEYDLCGQPSLDVGADADSHEDSPRQLEDDNNNTETEDEEDLNLSNSAVENDRKHNDLAIGSMGVRPHGQQRIASCIWNMLE